MRSALLSAPSVPQVLGREPRLSQTLLCLVGLAVLNQFFLSSWTHSPDLPSCHSLPGQLKAALFWELDPRPVVLLPRGTDVAPGPVSPGEVSPTHPVYFS